MILEAMARGLAVIATRVGAVPALAGDDCGRLIDPMKTSQLRDALRQMAEMSEEKLYDLRVNALAKVSRSFRWSDVADHTLRAIEKVTHHGVTRPEVPDKEQP